MDVALSAIAKGDGQRAATTKAVFGLTVTNGILGTFTINATGDTSQGTITIYKQVGTDAQLAEGRRNADADAEPDRVTRST